MRACEHNKKRSFILKQGTQLHCFVFVVDSSRVTVTRNVICGFS